MTAFWLITKGQSDRLRNCLARRGRELETDIGKLKDRLITDFHAFFTAYLNSNKGEGSLFIYTST